MAASSGTHPSGANVDPDTGQLSTNFDDTASPEGCVDTADYVGSGRVMNRAAASPHPVPGSFGI